MDTPYAPVIGRPSRRVRTPRLARYFQRVVGGYSGQLELCVVNWQGDPDQTVASFTPGGELRQWDKRVEGDFLVFRAPFDWDRTGIMRWHYDPARQATEEMPREEAARLMLGNRVSG